MAKQRRPKRRRLRSCENNGGLGILPCESFWPAEVTLKVDTAFTCSDSDTLHLCSKCADLFIETCEGVRRWGGGRRRLVTPEAARRYYVLLLRFGIVLLGAGPC
jgi:hypothetical protein